MPVDAVYLARILEQLSGIPDITHKKMFGGIGFFHGKNMFGAIMNERDSFRLKVNDMNRAEYEAAGMSAFFMEKMGRDMPYWTVPEEVIADRAELAKWVAKAVAVAGKKK